MFAPSAEYATERLLFAPFSCWTAPARESLATTSFAETSSTEEPPLAATTLSFLPAADSGTWMLGPVRPSSRVALSSASTAYQAKLTLLVTSMPFVSEPSTRLAQAPAATVSPVTRLVVELLICGEAVTRSRS